MKEGGRTQAQAQLDARFRPPGRKHVGLGVVHPDAHEVHRLLLQNEEIWLTGDPGADDPQPFYGSMASGLTSYFAGDTTAQLDMARALYAQMRRDVGRSYGNDIDYSVEAAT